MLLPSRKITAAFIGVFLIGAAVGALLLISFSDLRFSRFLTSTSDPKSMATRINLKYLKEYHLSPDEQARIAPLTQQMTQQLYVTRRQFGVDIMATLDDYHRKIGEQMSPEHREAFEKANVERKKRMSATLLLDPSAATPAQN
jgi:uncharacterized membrane protein